MEFKMKLKTGKDMRKDYKKMNGTKKGGEPLTDDLYNTVKSNSVASGWPRY